MNLTINFSWWGFLVCISIGILFSFLLYRKYLRNQELTNKILYPLCLLRFLSVSLLTFLLFSPAWQHRERVFDKPIIVLAQDNTASILMSKDSLFYQKEYLKQLDLLERKLSEKHDVQRFSFGRTLQKMESDYTFDESRTNISSCLEEIKNRFNFRNICGLILATDGIYNEGYSPSNSLDPSTYPIYTIAMGDTTAYKDLTIEKINYNRIAYLNNEFPVSIIIRAQKSLNERAKINIRHKGTVIFSDTLLINQENYVGTIQAFIQAKAVGIQTYSIEIEPVKNESNLENNSRQISIEILDGREKILLLAYSPHPDISAIKSALEANENYEVDFSLIKNLKEPLDKYNLIILHQIPAINDIQGLKTLDLIKKKSLSALFILGGQSDISQFNLLNLGLNIKTSGNTTRGESTPAGNQAFTLFTLSTKLQEITPSLPPLSVGFGDYALASNAQILFYQRIGNVATSKPLILFASDGDKRYGFITGEGIWRWKLSDFNQNGVHTNFNEIIQKTAQYLVAKRDKSRLKIIHKPIFDQTDPLVFEAEFYNESYELINFPPLHMTISDTAGNEYEYLFNQTENHYNLNIGFLPIGSYIFKTKVQLDGKSFTKDGSFVVEPTNIESCNLVADHTLLHTLSAQSGGVMVYPHALDSLAKIINQRDDIKPIARETIQYRNLLDSVWVFIIILLLFSAEWFIRKYNGLI